jgi:hypothetical protein
MRTTSLIAVLIATVTCCVGAALLASNSPAAAPPGVRGWEYKVMFSVEVVRLGGQQADKGANPTTAGLNSLGADGWELVTVENSPIEAAKVYLKRPK